VFCFMHKIAERYFKNIDIFDKKDPQREGAKVAEGLRAERV